jgi:hypothetical protein
MTYEIEFIHHLDGQAEALAMDAVRLIGDGGIAAAITAAEQLFRELDIVPHPDGFRIRESDGAIVHEYHQFNGIEHA